MRPKFKIWDKIDNCWYKPIYKAYEGNLYELLLDCGGRLVLNTGKSTMTDESRFPNRFEVVMCTGEKDKNGKDIYYGDVYIDSQGVYEVKDFTVAYWIIDGHKMNDPMRGIEVIGNVWESPDLVRETNERRQNDR